MERPSLTAVCSYAILNYSRATNAVDSGKMLGFATAGTVVLLDLGAGGMM